MEQVRIVKEMRAEDEASGRAGVDIRPRYMVWENVPGAFSSNKGEDFRIVLEELAKVKDKNAVIPMPESGKWTTSGCIVADGWSIAWRVLEAQFWGVPQRRRRIALVADFGGESAPEILFVRKSVSGDIEPSEQKRKAASSDAQGGFGADDRVGIDLYNTDITGDVSSTLGVNCGKQHGRNGVLGFHLLQDPIESEDKTPCMGTGNNKNGQASIGVVYGVDAYNQALTGDVAKSLNSAATDTDHIPAVVVALDRASFNQGKNAQFDFEVCDKGINSPLVAKGPSAVVYCIGNGQVHDAQRPDENLSKTLNCLVDPMKIMIVSKARYIVRRLTPLECERLQGYPDGWTDIGEWVDSKGKVRQTSDAARYKALGNSIALPPWKWVLKRLCACYERDATMASLFDGIGGFPYLWEQLNGKGTCLWASEIEEFPIAVTKVRIGE